MKETFSWNPYADQPHNVGSRGRRFLRHLAHAPSYLGISWSNLKKVVPVIMQYRFHRAMTGRFPARIENPFAVAVSPVPGREPEILAMLQELDISRSLLRIPSWESDRLEMYERFFSGLNKRGIEVLISLLQCREDVLDPARWIRFVREVFSRFQGEDTFFEVGHAWNRTKWGVWDHREYVRLARQAAAAAEEYGASIVGPAVIDFEFHLYPPVLERISFDVVSSLLYVDRSGPPEGKQFGWDMLRKLALLRAVVDKCSRKGQELWITEVNWPLKDTGKYSPAAGRPNVSEEEQADYLVRYHLLALSSGWVDRIYWWQLVAPGYGLVDSRSVGWRRRPAFRALQTLKRFCGNSVYQGRYLVHPTAHILSFCRGREVFAAGWTEGEPIRYRFPLPVKRVVGRDGEELTMEGPDVTLDGHPKYVFLEGAEAQP